MLRNELKADARRLAEHLRTKYGWKLKSSSALEAVAACYGAKDWNTLSAIAGPQPGGSAGLVDCSDTKATFERELTLNLVVKSAKLANAREIHISISNENTAITFRGPRSTISFANSSVAAGQRMSDFFCVTESENILSVPQPSYECGTVEMDLDLDGYVELRWVRYNRCSTEVNSSRFD